MIVINTRTPYSIVVNNNNQTETYLELTVWNKGQTEPPIPNFVFEQAIPSTLNRITYYNISEYLNDFIDNISPTLVINTIQEASNLDWCLFKYSTFALINNVYLAIDTNIYGVGLNGYNEYELGVNNKKDLNIANPTSQSIFLNENIVLNNSFYHKWNANYPPAYNVLVMQPDNTLFVVDYFSAETTMPVLGSLTYTITPNEIYLLTVPIAFFQSLNITKQKAIITYASSQETQEFLSEYICEAKYKPYTCSYINKAGGWDSITFFKASSENIEIQSTSYNFSDQFNYNPKRGQKQTFNITGTNKIKLNTGFIEEFENIKIKQLMLSEKILIDNLPVILSTKSYEIKTHLKDYNINYTLEFEYAFGIINDAI